MDSYLTKEDILFLDDNKSEMTYLSGETILKQGSYTSQIIYLKSGLLKVILEGKNGKNTILKLVASKNYIALPILGNTKIYPYTVEAITDCETCLIRKETILEILNRNINANRFLIDWYTNDYIYMHSKITTISTRNNHGKLASALLYLTSGEFEKNTLNILTRKDLAELASISIDSTNKILMELKNDRIIGINKNNITILKPELVEKLSTIS